MKAYQLNNRTEFIKLESAKRFIDHCVKMHMIVLGDNGKFWVMLPKYSEQLVKVGYEYAK